MGIIIPIFDLPSAIPGVPDWPSSWNHWLGPLGTLGNLGTWAPGHWDQLHHKPRTHHDSMGAGQNPLVMTSITMEHIGKSLFILD